MKRSKQRQRASSALAGGLLLLLALCSSRPGAAIKVRVWTNVTDPDFVYPELNPYSDFGIPALQQKPSLGIAMSGGGLRAAPLAYGWLRALYLVCSTPQHATSRDAAAADCAAAHHPPKRTHPGSDAPVRTRRHHRGCRCRCCTHSPQMNVTSKAQYLSANSGGAWVAAPFAYTPAPLSRFFSPYFEPANLTTTRLSMSLTPGSWGSAAAGKSLLLGAIGNPGEQQGRRQYCQRRHYGGSRRERVSLARSADHDLLPPQTLHAATAPGEPTAWANNIAAIFLNPFGVGSSDSSVSANGTNGRILQQTRKKLLPGFPISVACNNNR